MMPLTAPHTLTRKLRKATRKIDIDLRGLHRKQKDFVFSKAKFVVIRAGRRGGKTVGVARRDVLKFINGRRVLYATPTSEQLQSYWDEVTRLLRDPIEKGIFTKNETNHTINRPGTKQRIKGKTAWNADTLRGDYADELTLDEYQLMAQEAWDDVGAPMLFDNDGNATFVFTPPKPHHKAVGYRHAMELYKTAEEDTTGEWEAFHFTSHDNPYISKTALERAIRNMPKASYRREVLAEADDEAAGALWTQALLDETRVSRLPTTIDRIVIGVDPPGGGTECGIMALVKAAGHTYIFADRSIQASPSVWSKRVIDLAEDSGADKIVGEVNFGGDMVEEVITQAFPPGFPVRYENVRASRGKAIRAEPLVARFERKKAHIVGELADLEKELTTWVPDMGMDSPNRLDAMVWADAELNGELDDVEIGAIQGF